MPINTPPWEIIGQREDYRPGPTGGFVSGVVVSFRTLSGAVGSVFVPDSVYTPENVAQAVNARAATMETVANLTGG